MTEDDGRWLEVDSLFAEVLDRSPAERVAYLEGACSDPAIRARVRALLEAEAASAPFLSRRPSFLRALPDALRGHGAKGGGGAGDREEAGEEPEAG